ncbi:MAG: hypothetical protein L6V93_10785 [Clostridiales bacterium]|nr:MAG: hypothetical protein L6V93_10785 [Clostridiales bacterium]
MSKKPYGIFLDNFGGENLKNALSEYAKVYEEYKKKNRNLTRFQQTKPKKRAQNGPFEISD